MSIPHVIGGEITSQELNDNFSYLDSYKAEVLEADTVVTVGSNGDFGTISMALTMFTRTFPYYVQNGLKAEIRLLSGFVMEEQVLIKGLDMGWITITSEDAEVMVNRSALTTPFTGNVYPLFGAEENAVLPVIDVLFNMDNSGTASGRHGFVIRDNSRAHFKEGAGCKNAGDRGLHVLNASVVCADGVIFSGAGSDGVVATGSSTVSVRGGNFSNAGHHGVWSINNSMINAREVDATNA